MKHYLIALDMDGTLMYDWTTLLPETIDGIKRLKQQGHTFVIATGRPFRSTEKFYDLLELDTPMINYNGGIISSKNDPNFEEQLIWLEKNSILDVMNRHNAIINNAFCEIKDDIYLLKDDPRLYNFLHLENGAKLHIGDFVDILPGPTNGCILLCDLNHAQTIEDDIKKRYPGKLLARNWGSPEQAIIELYTPKTNKGEALLKVADYLGFKQEDIIAFGDGINDFELIQTAGWGVAMINGVDALKHTADDITHYDHKHNGVIRYLDDYLQNTK